jgi:hypothetical protein
MPMCHCAQSICSFRPTASRWQLPLPLCVPLHCSVYSLVQSMPKSMKGRWWSVCAIRPIHCFWFVRIKARSMQHMPIKPWLNSLQVVVNTIESTVVVHRVRSNSHCQQLLLKRALTHTHTHMLSPVLILCYNYNYNNSNTRCLVVLIVPS